MSYQSQKLHTNITQQIKLVYEHCAALIDIGQIIQSNEDPLVFSTVEKQQPNLLKDKEELQASYHQTKTSRKDVDALETLMQIESELFENFRRIIFAINTAIKARLVAQASWTRFQVPQPDPPSGSGGVLPQQLYLQVQLPHTTSSTQAPSPTHQL